MCQSCDKFSKNINKDFVNDTYIRVEFLETLSKQISVFTMARNFKISFDDRVGEKEVFAVKPNSDDFDSLKEELYARKPELRNKSLKFYYEGKFHANVREFDSEKGDVIMYAD